MKKIKLVGLTFMRALVSTEEHEESVYNLYISEVRNIRLRLENCEDRLIRQIRTPLERDDLAESVFRISEQEVSLFKLLMKTTPLNIKIKLK